MVELVARTLTRLEQSGVRLSDCDLRIQSDNTVREMKNNILLRYMAMLVSSATLRSISLGCLTSGHSHEDIDQMFGSVARFVIRKCKVANTPMDFQSILVDFLAQLPRAHEPNRWVVKLDKVRDWSLVMIGKLLVAVRSV